MNLLSPAPREWQQQAAPTVYYDTDDVPALSPRVVSAGELTGTWAVAHVKSRQEKLLAVDLAGRGVDYFLPLYEVETRYPHGRHVARLPLFPGYLCFNGDAKGETAAEVYSTGRVCRCIEVKNQTKFHADIAQLDRVLQLNPRIDPCPELVTGRQCRVRTGAFMGLCGVILGRGAGQRVVLGLEGLGQASLEIPMAQVEPL